MSAHLDPHSSDFGDVPLYYYYYIPLSCTSSLCNLLFLNLGLYGLFQATVGVGSALIWDLCVAYTRGGGTFFMMRILRRVCVCVCVPPRCSLMERDNLVNPGCSWL